MPNKTMRVLLGDDKYTLWRAKVVEREDAPNLDYLQKEKELDATDSQ